MEGPEIASGDSCSRDRCGNEFLRGNYQTAIEHCQQNSQKLFGSTLVKRHEQRIAAIGVLSEAKLRLGLKKEAAECNCNDWSIREWGIPILSLLRRETRGRLALSRCRTMWEKGELLAREFAMALRTPGHDDFLLGAWAYVARFASSKGKSKKNQ